jgi:hypothetical protein
VNFGFAGDSQFSGTLPKSVLAVACAIVLVSLCSAHARIFHAMI